VRGVKGEGKAARPRKRKPKAAESPQIVVVLLTNSKQFDDVYAVSKNGGKTTLSYRAKDFGTVGAAEIYLTRGLVPEGYRGWVDVIDRGERKVRPKLVTVKSAVARRSIMPGQMVFLDDLEP
jgi:hypothetical protein